jgi:hypothetical protein
VFGLLAITTYFGQSPKLLMVYGPIMTNPYDFHGSPKVNRSAQLTVTL